MSIRPFLDLAPSQPIFVVLVTTVHGDGTSTVEFPGGSSFIALGTGVSSGNHAFIRARQILGEAPAVDPITLELPVAPPLPNLVLAPSGSQILAPSGAPLLYA